METTSVPAEFNLGNTHEDSMTSQDIQPEASSQNTTTFEEKFISKPFNGEVTLDEPLRVTIVGSLMK
jgi:hypothetical protein